MSDSAPNNALTQRETFNQLVDDGTYSAEFEHSTEMKQFVATTVRKYLPQSDERGVVRLLECGCGTGSWLRLASEILQEAGRNPLPMGFDVSDRMVAVAQQVLRDSVGGQKIRQGDLLASGVFDFPGCEGGFDLVITYDVIQQLPPPRQREACQRIAEHLAVEGVALIFDQDLASPFGRRMQLKKVLRRYFGIPLIPAYFCNATYPKLAEIRDALNETTGISAEIIAAPTSPKRALVIRRGSL